MKNPLVSVLMTAFNRAKYIGEAIESVIASTYTNWELIITDDCSTDNTYQIALSYAKKDNRIKVFLNERNLRDYPNRNRAASYAKGTYLKYLDADDMLYPHSLEVMVRCMEENKSCAMGITINKVCSQTRPFPIVFTPQESYMRQFLGFGMFTTGPTGMIIRRKEFEEAKGFQVEKYAGDTEFMLRLGAKYDTLVLPKDLFWWREHEDQQIKQSHTNNAAAVLYYIIYLNHLSSDCPLPEKFRQLAIKKLKRRFCITLIKEAIIYHSPFKALKMKQEANIKWIDFLRAAIKDERIQLTIPY